MAARRGRDDGHGHGHAARQGQGLPAARSGGCSATLRPERPLIVGVILLAIVSVTFTVIGPKILGNAINRIFEGALGAQLPAGVTQEQVDRRAAGAGPEPARRHALEHAPDARPGIDFGALGGLLVLLVAVYVLSSIFGWMQG